MLFDYVANGHPHGGAASRPVQSRDADSRGPDGARLRGRHHLARHPRHRSAGAAAAATDPRRQTGQHARHPFGWADATGCRSWLAGIGIHALEESFQTRGARMDEAIRVLGRYRGDEKISATGRLLTTVAMAMEPKPPQGGRLPIWIGGNSASRTRRVGRFGRRLAGQLRCDANDRPSPQRATHSRGTPAKSRPRSGHIGLQTMVDSHPRCGGPGVLRGPRRRRWPRRGPSDDGVRPGRARRT